MHLEVGAEAARKVKHRAKSFRKVQGGADRGRVVGCLDVRHAHRRPAARRRRRRPRPGRGHRQGDPRLTTSKSPATPATAAIRSSIRRARRIDEQGQPAPLTDLQAAVDDAIAALDRLERAVKVRPGDDPRLLGLIRGAKDSVRAVADRTA